MGGLWILLGVVVWAYGEGFVVDCGIFVDCEAVIESF